MLAIADRLTQAGMDRFAWGLRTCGGLIQMEEGPDAPLRRLPCNLRFCPACQGFRQRQVAARLVPRVKEILGAKGVCIHLGLTPGPSPETTEGKISAMALARQSIFRKQAWKGANGWKAKVGMVLVTEISHGNGWAGHPHHHALVCGAIPEEVHAFVEWMTKKWLETMEHAQPAGQWAKPMGHDPSRWAPRLNYILKGSQVRLEWPEGLLLDAVAELTSGHNHQNAYGLLRKSSMQTPKESGVRGARNDYGLVGNPERATA